MIVVVGGIKGGSGKTTIATNLSVIRSATGKKVLLVDADEQNSASDWAQQRESLENKKEKINTIQLFGKGVYSQVQKMALDYDDVIIDVGGTDTTSQRSALTIAHVFITPFKPRSLDIWTLGALQNLINEIKAINPNLKCISVINQADSRGSDNADAIEILKDCEDMECHKTPIGCRKSFGNAAAQGLSVVELKDVDEKASKEINTLYEYIFNTCNPHNTQVELTR